MPIYRSDHVQLERLRWLYRRDQLFYRGQQQQQPGTYLQGTFSVHQFSASSPAGANPLWERTTLTINAQGQGTFSNTVDSLGGSNNGSNVQFSISPAGILTIAGESNFQGILWLDKNKFVAVNGSTDRELIFGQRQPTGMATANLAGTWIFSQIWEVAGTAVVWPWCAPHPPPPNNRSGVAPRSP